MRFPILVFLSFFSGIVHAQSWDMDPEQSRLRLTAQVYDAPFEAEFTQFDANIVFDPNNLAEAKVTATIDLVSLEPDLEGDAIYISELQGADWFFSNKFPTAIFASQRFSDLGNGTYKVDGILAIRDKATPISFDFDLSIDGDQADMRATIPLDRFDLGLGLGTHPNANTVEAAVMMDLEIRASR